MKGKLLKQIRDLLGYRVKKIRKQLLNSLLSPIRQLVSYLSVGYIWNRRGKVKYINGKWRFAHQTLRPIRRVPTTDPRVQGVFKFEVTAGTFDKRRYTHGELTETIAENWGIGGSGDRPEIAISGVRHSWG